MRGRTRAFAAATTVPLLLAAACSTAEKQPGGSNSAAGPGQTATMCPSGGQLTDVYKRPKVAQSGNITAAVEEAVHDYNNNTSTANNFANSLLSVAEPSAFMIDSNLGVCPDGDLLTSVEQTSTDPLTIVYKIRPEAVWSDGTPVSCKDFYLPWLAANSKAKGSGGTLAFDPVTVTGYDQMKAPACSDNGKTVTATFTKPFGDWKKLFTTMVPAHVIENAAGGTDVTTITPDDTSAKVTSFASAYIKKFTGFDAAADLSAGPYLLKSRTDEQSVLVRNDKWWGEKAGPDSITIVTNPDGQSEVQSLQNQEVQIIQPQPDAGLAQQLRGAGGVKFNATAGLTYEHIDFQMKLPLFQGDTGKALRQAVFLCVDRTDIITKLVKAVNPETAPLGNFMFMPNEKGYADHYADYTTANTDKAKQVMEAAGWKLGGDGVYEVNGKKAAFRLGHKVIDNRERIAQLVGASCGKAGIKITDDQDAEFNAKRLPAGDFDAALFAWVGTPFKSDNTPNYTTGGGGNYNGYSNKEVDALFKTANSATDDAKRTEALNKIDELMAADKHSLPLYQFADMMAQRDTITPALSYDGVFGGVFWNAYEWSTTG